MSVFEGEIEFKSVYMNDFVKKTKPKIPRRRAVDDDCLIVGLSRDALKPRDTPRRLPETLCPLEHEYYKKAVGRISEEHPSLAEKYMSREIDIVPIENEIQDLKRTEYLVKYCSRELPFMSVNLARRARAVQTFHLPDHVDIPDTTQRASYRQPPLDKYKVPPSSISFKPKYDDDSLQRELRRITRVRTGDTNYSITHGLLGQVIKDKNPFGPPREEPKYGRWKTPYIYTYRMI